jgi:hypothetical protein
VFPKGETPKFTSKEEVGNESCIIGPVIEGQKKPKLKDANVVSAFNRGRYDVSELDAIVGGAGAKNVYGEFKKYRELEAALSFIPKMLLVEALRYAYLYNIDEIWVADGNEAYVERWGHGKNTRNGATVLDFYNDLAASFGGEYTETSKYNLKGSAFGGGTNPKNLLKHHYRINVKKALAKLGELPQQKKQALLQHKGVHMDQINYYKSLVGDTCGIKLTTAQSLELAKAVDRIVVAQVKQSQMTQESQMAREVPGEITPVEVEDDIVVDPGAADVLEEDPAALGDEGLSPDAVEDDAPTHEDAMDRATKLQTDVDELREAFTEVLQSSYSITLSESEMDELMRKIINTIASYVTDVTVDRVEDITGLSED